VRATGTASSDSGWAISRPSSGERGHNPQSR
jgi:hypothetical protein